MDKPIMRKIISGFIYWSRFIMTGIIVILTGILFVSITVVGEALFSIKWFARANKKISAFTRQAQNDFYDMNVRFPKKSFMYLSSLNRMVNVYQTEQRAYPLLIGCGEFDIPMELEAVKIWEEREPQCKVVIFENAGHCVNMDTPQIFNDTLEAFWN